KAQPQRLGLLLCHRRIITNPKEEIPHEAVAHQPTGLGDKPRATDQVVSNYFAIIFNGKLHFVFKYIRATPTTSGSYAFQNKIHTPRY
ncbi:MAG: hypothetical protein WA476_03390, partial [Acidobacteriaceae bacterium]